MSDTDYDYDSDASAASSGVSRASGEHAVPSSLRTYLRFMVSLDECGRIFGPQGQFLRKVKSDNHVKIDVSEKRPGCSDRILTCAGTIADIAGAMRDLASLLVASQPREPADRKRYPFYFLNSFLAPPTLADFGGSVGDLRELADLRVILTNTQVSSVIGKQGRTIRQLAQECGVRIVASRNFLPDSDERVLQLQGPVDALGDAVMAVAKVVNSEINIDQITERHYEPHVLGQAPEERDRTHRPSTDEQRHDSAPRARNNRRDNNARDNTTRDSTAEFTATVMVPESLVGAMMGARGNRISNLRKYTHTRVDTGKPSGNGAGAGEFRHFVVSGDSLDNVKKAEGLLLANLENEVARREAAAAGAADAATASASASADVDMDIDDDTSSDEE